MRPRPRRKNPPAATEGREKNRAKTSETQPATDGKPQAPPRKGASPTNAQTILLDPKPWPESVEGAQVLDEVACIVEEYLSLPPGAADAISLWVAHAHCYEAFMHSPRLNAMSPEKGCGKTTLLGVLAPLSPRSVRIESISPAVVFRSVDRFRPTLLLDEVDGYLRHNRDLLHLLNAGHERNGKAARCEGEYFEVRWFKAFCPVALAGIGSLGSST